MDLADIRQAIDGIDTTRTSSPSCAAACIANPTSLPVAIRMTIRPRKLPTKTPMVSSAQTPSGKS